jgi:hypothetical protein
VLHKLRGSNSVVAIPCLETLRAHKMMMKNFGQLVRLCLALGLTSVALAKGLALWQSEKAESVQVEQETPAKQVAVPSEPVSKEQVLNEHKPTEWGIVQQASNTVSRVEQTNVCIPAVFIPLPSQVVTTDGTVYNQVKLLRVEPDGLAVEFTPQGGGIGMGKIRFARLPADLQHRYGYDAKKVAAYEAEQARGKAQLTAKMWADFQVASTAAKKYREENEREFARREEERIRLEEEWKQQEEERKQQEEERKEAQREADAAFQAEMAACSTFDTSDDAGWVASKDQSALKASGLDPKKYVQGYFLKAQPPLDGKYRPPVPDTSLGPVFMSK